MTLLKIITAITWVIIAIIGLFVLAGALFPAKGSDPAGRGIGMAIYLLVILLLAVLVWLNLKPQPWAKYTAFGLVAVPAFLMYLGPAWRAVSASVEGTKPVFEDKERDRLAKAIRDGKPEKVKQLLQSPVLRLQEGGELLAYAIVEANSSEYKPAEKLECVRLLFDAGVRLDSIQGEVPVHMAVAEVGNAPLLRLLLEHGANANAYQIHFKRPILFEAIASYKEPVASVRALLDFGADPNATATFDDAVGPVSPLWKAAELQRWGVCIALLEKGARPDLPSPAGKDFRTFVVESEKEIFWEDHSTTADYERLKHLLQ